MSLFLAALALAVQFAPVTDSLRDDPCRGAPSIPDAVNAYRRTQIFADGRPFPAEPPELASFRAANAEWAKHDWANLCLYRADNERLASRPPAERRVIFMGDSITNLWRLAHPEFFASGYVNRGINGQTTQQMLLRFQADVIGLRPEAVHILAGTNDVAGSDSIVEDFKNNIMAMVALARANDIRVILASIPPALVIPGKPAMRPEPQIRELNAWLRDYARKEKVDYIDYHAVLTAADGSMLPPLTFDGVHPSARGYEAMEPLVRRAVR